MQRQICCPGRVARLIRLNPKFQIFRRSYPCVRRVFALVAERPIFAGIKLAQNELGEHQISADIGCHLFASLPPFEIGGATMGYGLGPAANAAFDGGGEKRISIIGDGGFWHNGLSTSIGNMVYNRADAVAVVVDNYYSAATGGQDLLSSRASNATKATNNPITDAVKGIGKMGSSN